MFWNPWIFIYRLERQLHLFSQWICVAHTQQWCPVVVKYAHFKTTFTAFPSVVQVEPATTTTNIKKTGQNSTRKMKICSLQFAGAENNYLFSSLDCHLKNEMAQLTTNTIWCATPIYLLIHFCVWRLTCTHTHARAFTQTKLGKLSCDNVPLNASI